MGRTEVCITASHKVGKMSFTRYAFREYGLTDHAGMHRLRGPGLDEKIGQGGVSAMGGKWPVWIDGC